MTDSTPTDEGHLTLAMTPGGLVHYVQRLATGTEEPLCGTSLPLTEPTGPGAPCGPCFAAAQELD